LSSPTVFIVDDDAGIRYSLPVLLRTAQVKTECFSSAEAFLEALNAEQIGCLVLDVRMPGLSGPQLQMELARRRVRLPIIFLTGYADLPVGVEAMKQGAVDFLTKPVNGERLLACVQAALEVSRAQEQAEIAKRAFSGRLQKLTRREREVLRLAVSGKENRAVAAELQISERTVEGHRARIYLRTGVRSLLELSRAAADAGVDLTRIALDGDILAP
jgi:FixJ family two-component response regulator